MEPKENVKYNIKINNKEEVIALYDETYLNKLISTLILFRRR